MKDTDAINLTQKKFSFGWSKFAKKEIDKQWYKDSFSYLEYMPADIFKGKGKLGMDVGCGSGADMTYLSRYEPDIVGIDISNSLIVTRENIKKFRNLHLAQADIYNLPFKNGTFDFVYSFGVLHHLPDPEKGFRALVEKVKKDGRVIIYVYEDFSERSALERLLLKAVNFFRIITTRMPAPVLYVLCIIISPLVLICCSLPYQVLRRMAITKRIAQKMPFRHTTKLDCIVSDLYDRFSPPIEKRYARKEVEDWFKRAGLKDVNIINYRGWVAWGTKI